jgi:hypothetical protein
VLNKWLGRKKESDDKDLFQPHMPQVDHPADLAAVFSQARQFASKEKRPEGIDPASNYLVMVTPGRMLMFKACPKPGSMSPESVAAFEGMMPSSNRLNIAVIAYTEMQAVMKDIRKAIPAIGLFFGYGYIGHSIWMFEGHPSALEEGCRDADLLIVDQTMRPYLPEGWHQVAARQMRQKQILVYDPVGQKLLKVK